MPLAQRVDHIRHVISAKVAALIHATTGVPIGRKQQNLDRAARWGRGEWSP